ncbi:MAG: DUF1440 domain-containing protein [Chloroflexota bacterium]
MRIFEDIQDTVIGLASGYAGDKVMGRATTALSGMESQDAKEQEKKVSPGISYNIAAGDLAKRAGMQLTEEQASRVGSLFHLGLGLGGGEAYVAMRRRFGLSPVVSSLIVSLGLWLSVDEGLTPAMGWSAPDADYPLETHVRALAGHLALGTTIAAVAEVLAWLMRRPLGKGR